MSGIFRSQSIKVVSAVAGRWKSHFCLFYQVSASWDMQSWVRVYEKCYYCHLWISEGEFCFLMRLSMGRITFRKGGCAPAPRLAFNFGIFVGRDCTLQLTFLSLLYMFFWKVLILGNVFVFLKFTVKLRYLYNIWEFPPSFMLMLLQERNRYLISKLKST